jgi:ABC-2 type transport system permease protein
MSNFTANWIGFQTLLAKEMRRFLRIWVQTILPSAITVTLYIAIFGSFIGSRILPIEGYSYLQYIIPGLIMMAVINNAYSNVVSSLYGARFQKSIEEILISPMPNYLILLGYTLGGIARGMLVAIVVTCIALFFTHLHTHSVLQIFGMAILSASLFSLAGFLNAIFAKKFDDTTIVPTFILTPLTYLGGVFYSINLLPPFWHTVSLLNPILYIVNAFRYAILGISDVNVAASFICISLMVVVLFLVNLYLLDRGVGIRT